METLGTRKSEAAFRSSDSAPNPQPFRFRRRDDPKPPLNPTPKRAKSPISTVPAQIPVPPLSPTFPTPLPHPQEDYLKMQGDILKSLSHFQKVIIDELKIDVKTPREEELVKLTCKNNQAEEELNRLNEKVRVAEERNAMERKALLEREQEDNRMLADATQVMEASVSELKRELHMLNAKSSIYEHITSLKLEVQGESLVKGSSLVPTKHFTFKLDMKPGQAHYRNLTEPANDLDPFLQHEISGLRSSELPMLFRRMLMTLYPEDN